MGDVLEGKVLVVGQGEALSNGGMKYPLVLDNGSQLVTFSEKCKDAVSGKLGVPLLFEVDPPPFEGAHPKVTKVSTADGATVWEPSERGGGGGGGGGDPVHQHARTVLIQAGELVAARANAYTSEEEMAAAVAKLVPPLASLLKEAESLFRA